MTTDCTCGGCGTGTTCVHTNTTLKNNAQHTVTAYATPDILGQPTREPWAQPQETSDSFFFFNPRATLGEELLKDLLERVQKVESGIGKLRKKNSDLKKRINKLIQEVDRLRGLVKEV